MDGKSPKDKLLDACGMHASRVPSPPPKDQESRKYYQALLDRAEDASAWAQQAQEQTERSYRRLNDYLLKDLPPQLVRAFGEVAQKEIACTLRPLHDSLGKEAARIDSCAEELFRMSLNWRLMLVAVAVGIATVSLGAVMVRYTLLDSHFEEEKRYEIWGRDVAARLEKSSPKERERILKWVRGGPL